MDVPHVPSLQDHDESGIRTINQYVVHQKIGEGAFAKVKLVHVINEPNKVYAMKVVKKEQKKKPRKSILGSLKAQSQIQDEDINREVAVMKKMKHPNIVRLREVIDDSQMRKLYMILELVKGGPCFVIDQEPLNEEQARSDFIDTIIGISFMHKNHIIHHDIKPANLLRDENGNIKISDFGMSSYYEDMTVKIREVRGTPAFISPEIVDIDTYPDGYTPSLADVYALGATLFMLVYGHPPYHQQNKYELYQQAINDALPFDTDENKEITNRISPELRNILEGTLEKDPSKRLTIEQLRSHAWVTYNGTVPLPDEMEKVEVTNQELDMALTPLLPFHVIIALKVTMKNKLIVVRRKLAEQKKQKEQNDNKDSAKDDQNKEQRKENIIEKDKQQLKQKDQYKQVLFDQYKKQQKEQEIKTKKSAKKQNQRGLSKVQVKINEKEQEKVQQKEQEKEQDKEQEKEQPNQQVKNLKKRKSDMKIAQFEQQELVQQEKEKQKVSLTRIYSMRDKPQQQQQQQQMNIIRHYNVKERPIQRAKSESRLRIGKQDSVMSTRRTSTIKKEKKTIKENQKEDKVKVKEQGQQYDQEQEQQDSLELEQEQEQKPAPRDYAKEWKKILNLKGKKKKKKKQEGLSIMQNEKVDDKDKDTASVKKQQKSKGK